MIGGKEFAWTIFWIHLTLVVFGLATDASSTYWLWVNGSFVALNAARVGHGLWVLWAETTRQREADLIRQREMGFAEFARKYHRLTCAAGEEDNFDCVTMTGVFTEVQHKNGPTAGATGTAKGVVESTRRS